MSQQAPDLATQIAFKVLAVPEERRVAATMEEVTQYMEELRANHPMMSEEDLKDKGFTFLNDIRLACIKLTQGGNSLSHAVKPKEAVGSQSGKPQQPWHKRPFGKNRISSKTNVC
ncbi:MAG TPA: hypothetical protein VM715_03945 [Candidatus Acidoferrum sp.]|nr:hypothetical protein [Candidatus Acidoferrum sp.]